MEEGIFRVSKGHGPLLCHKTEKAAIERRARSQAALNMGAEDTTYTVPPTPFGTQNL